MAKTTKPKIRRSQENDVKIGNINKKAIDKLVACVAATRDLQNTYYSELKLLLTQRKKPLTTTSKQEMAALLEIFKIGPSVFGSQIGFLTWLNDPSIALGRKTPLKLMLLKKSEIVRDELGRIEYGVLS